MKNVTRILCGLALVSVGLLSNVNIHAEDVENPVATPTPIASSTPAPEKTMPNKKVTSVKAKEKTGKFKLYKKGKKTIYEKYKYMQLSWKKVTGVSGYEVYRYGEASKQWYKVKTTTSKVTNYAIPEVEKGMKVQLKVRAYKKTISGKIYGEFSTVKKFTGKRNYWINGKQKEGKYWKKEKFWNPPKIKSGHYRFLSERAFVIQNQYRSQKGVAPLVWDEIIYEVSKIRSKDLSKQFSHIRPDGSSYVTALNEVLKKKGMLRNDYRFCGSGENATISCYTSQAAMTAWKKSSGHYANLMDKDYYNGAISCYVDKTEDFLWSANFMRQAPDSLVLKEY